MLHYNRAGLLLPRPAFADGAPFPPGAPSYFLRMRAARYEMWLAPGRQQWHQAGMFVLAHLSDPHLAPLMRPRLRELAGKRVIGVANWRWRRRLEHQMHVLDALLEDLAAQHPDHTAVTGDLVNVAAAGEFGPARSFLSRIGSPDAVTFVPGNHDAYVRATVPYAARHWGEFMTGDSPGGSAPHFPFLRRRGPVALIGLSTLKLR